MEKPATAGNTAGRALIDMIGVPFDGMGRSPGQAGAPEALRAAALAAVFGPDVAMEPDLVLPGPVAQRAAAPRSAASSASGRGGDAGAPGSSLPPGRGCPDGS